MYIYIFIFIYAYIIYIYLYLYIYIYIYLFIYLYTYIFVNLLLYVFINLMIQWFTLFLGSTVRRLPGHSDGFVSPLDVEILLSKIDTYAFCCGSSDDASVNRPAGGALFRIASFINHSCCPNAAVTWDAVTGEMVITALQTIEANEEITFSYIGHACGYFLNNWFCAK